MYWYLYCEICLIWIKLFSPLRALPPRCFENQRAATKWRLGRISTERRLIFQIQAVAKQLLNFWKLSERSFWRCCFILEESICPKDFIDVFSFFTRHTEGAVLLNIKWREAAHAYGKSATGARECWATGAHGRATRATCVRDIFILEEKLNGVRGGNTDVAALPIERRGGVYADPCAIEANLP